MSTTADLNTAITYALRAPSVHNSQPWRWSIRPDTVELSADLTRHLPWTDPDRRDLVLSCGAALHHLRVALAAQGCATRVDRLADPDNEWHLATVTITPGACDSADAELFPAIERRRTDRRRMSQQPVSQELIEALGALARREGALVVPTTGTKMHEHLASALADAAHRQADAPGYAAELQLWTHRYAGSQDGVPADRVAAPPPGLVAESPLRQFPSAALAQPRHPAGTGSADDASELLVLATPNDDRLSWLRAGEALSAVLLGATQIGLATTPLSQAIEVDATRERIRNSVLETDINPQIILRVGWPAAGAAELPATSRRDLHRMLS